MFALSIIQKNNTMKNLNTISEQNFNEVYNTFYSNLFHFVNNKVHDEDYSNAIVNDSFIKAYDSMKDFKPTLSSLSTWLHNIAKNKMIDHFRGAETLKRKADLTRINWFAPEHVDSVNGEKEMINKQLGLTIEKAFGKIKNDTHREIAKNFLVEGFSLKEISANFDIPVNSVKTIVKRVREALQSELQTVRA